MEMNITLDIFIIMLLMDISLNIIKTKKSYLKEIWICKEIWL